MYSNSRGKILFILLLCSLLPIFILNLFNYSDLDLFFQIGFLFLLCCIPLFLEKQIEIYNPVLLLSAIYFIKYGLGSVYIYLYPEYFYRYLELPVLEKGLYFIILCLLSFLLGYYAVNFSNLMKSTVIRILGSIPDIRNIDVNIRVLPITLFLLLCIGWFSRYLIFRLGAYQHIEAGQSVLATEYTYLAQILVFGALFPLVALCISFLKYLEKRQRVSLLVFTFLLLITEIAYALPTGSKEKVLLPILLMLVICSIREGTPKKTALFSCLVTVFVIFPLVNIYRLNYASGDIYYNMTQAVDFYLDQYLLFDRSLIENTLFSVFGIRLNYASVVSVIIEYTPDIWDYKLGYTYFHFFISLVPRFIWSGKPVIGGFGNEFGRDYGFIAANDYSTSVGMGWIGELFINFGWFGAIFCFFYGLLYKMIFIYFFRGGKPNTLGSLFFAFALYTMIRGDMFAPQFSGLLKYYVVLLVVLLPFTTRYKKQYRLL